RKIEHRLLPDLSGRHLLEADLDAGERLELRRELDQIVEVARRDHCDRDLLAFDLTPVELGALIRTEIGRLRVCAPNHVRPGEERRAGGQGLFEHAPAACSRASREACPELRRRALNPGY